MSQHQLRTPDEAEVEAPAASAPALLPDAQSLVGNQALLGEGGLLGGQDLGRAVQANFLSDAWSYLFGDSKKEPPTGQPKPTPAPAPVLSPEDQQKKDEQDAFRRKMGSEPGHDESRDGYRMAGFRIGQAYESGGREVNPDARVALGSKEERLAALNSLTQNDTTGQGEDMCGATSILAASLVAGGNDGVKDLIDTMSATGKLNKGELKELGAIQKRIQKGEQLSMADIQAVQFQLHSTLRRQQKEQISGEDDGGVDGKVIQNFISNPKMAKMFKDNEMGISRVDTDGDDKGNHFVLNLGRPSSQDAKVYDPYARKGGQQVVTDPDQLQDYDRARKHYLTPQG
jgi:hypothetical protein